jgi:hypothetical protein
MKVTVQVVIEAENGTSTMVQEVGQLEREGLEPENLGVKLVEVRTRVLNDELTDAFRRWYPRFDHMADSRELAA